MGAALVEGCSTRQFNQWPSPTSSKDGNVLASVTTAHKDSQGYREQKAGLEGTRKDMNTYKASVHPEHKLGGLNDDIFSQEKQ